MCVLWLKVILNGGLLIFLLARKIASRIIWTHEVRWAVLSAFAKRDYPECHVPTKMLPGLGHRRAYRAIRYCSSKGWLDWDMMVRITPAGREQLSRFRGEPHAPLPQARIITAKRSHS